MTDPLRAIPDALGVLGATPPGQPNATIANHLQ